MSKNFVVDYSESKLLAHDIKKYWKIRWNNQNTREIVYALTFYLSNHSFTHILRAPPMRASLCVLSFLYYCVVTRSSTPLYLIYFVAVQFLEKIDVKYFQMNCELIRSRNSVLKIQLKFFCEIILVDIKRAH